MSNKKMILISATMGMILGQPDLSDAAFRSLNGYACTFDSTSPNQTFDVVVSGTQQHTVIVDCPVSSDDSFPHNAVTGIFVDGRDSSTGNNATAKACVTFQGVNGSACGATALSGAQFTGIYSIGVDNSAWVANPTGFPFLFITLGGSVDLFGYFVSG